MKRIFALITAVLFLMSAVGAFAEGPGGNPPSDMPGGGPGGNPPSDMPGGPGGNPPGGGFGGGPGGSAADIEYSAATEVTSAAELQDGVYMATAADESALMVDTEEAVEISNPTVSKTGDSDGGDNCNFYGLNAAVLVKGGSTTTICWWKLGTPYSKKLRCWETCYSQADFAR